MDSQIASTYLDLMGTEHSPVHPPSHSNCRRSFCWVVVCIICQLNREAEGKKCPLSVTNSNSKAHSPGSANLPPVGIPSQAYALSGKNHCFLYLHSVPKPLWKNYFLSLNQSVGRTKSSALAEAWSNCPSIADAEWFESGFAPSGLQFAYQLKKKRKKWWKILPWLDLVLPVPFSERLSLPNNHQTQLPPRKSLPCYPIWF